MKEPKRVKKTDLSDSSDYREILAIMKKKHFAPNLSVERQIATHVRSLIQNKKLAVGTRLPPMRTLAEFWNTNYFTVQAGLSRLVHEGLIVKSPKKGSFIAPARRALRRVCLYHDHNLSSDWSFDFYSRLNITLYRILAERGIGVVPFFDHRPETSLNTMPPELRDMAKDGEIDALITTAIYPCNCGWLKKLEVPVASMMWEEPNQGVASNIESFARLAVEEAVRCNARSIGLIHVPVAPRAPETDPDALLTALQKKAAQKGISVVLPKPIPTRHLKWEHTGFQMCEELLKAKRPEMLFVYPDTFVRGVVTALLKNHIKVPEQLTLVSHWNAKSPIFVPFPMTCLTVSIEDYAIGLLEQIEQQVAGEPVRPFPVPVTLERREGEVSNARNSNSKMSAPQR